MNVEYVWNTWKKSAHKALWFREKKIRKFLIRVYQTNYSLNVNELNFLENTASSGKISFFVFHLFSHVE